MDALSRYRIELMDYSHVHVTIEAPSFSQDDVRFHYKRSLLADDDRFQELRQRATDALLTPKEAEEFGELLFQMLFDAVAQSKFLEVYTHLCQNLRLPLMVELTVDGTVSPELAGLPWEFLRLPFSEQHSAIWLSTNPHLCFLRKPLQHGTSLSMHLEASEKMRVAVIIADALLDAPVHAAPIVKHLETLATRFPEVLVPPKIIEQGTRKNIIRELRPFCPHLVHFIGHARFTNQMEGQVALIDEIPSGLPDWISAEQFGELFDPIQPGLKMILLQACESAVSSQTNTFTSVAAHILSHRIPAVVAMQYEVSNMTAGRFAHAFYDNLLQSGSVDQAVQEARFTISMEPASIGHYGYFATPVLFRGAQNGQMLVGQGDISLGISPEARTINHSYRSVRQYIPLLEDAERRCMLDTTLARDRCMKYQTMLSRFHQDLLSLHRALDNPGHNMPMIEYTSLFSISKMDRKVQELIKLLASFCPLCPPPVPDQPTVYSKQKKNITTAFQDVVTQMRALDYALQVYGRQFGWQEDD